MVIDLKGGVDVRLWNPDAPSGERMCQLPVNSMGPPNSNVYKKGGYYYLMLAEGGTGWNHGISMARAKSIAGPYARAPRQSVLTTRGDEGNRRFRSLRDELSTVVAGR
jgi:hypothetical protein